MENANNSSTCPNCGACTCPHCGRSLAPYYTPFYPYYPNYPYITWGWLVQPMSTITTTEGLGAYGGITQTGYMTGDTSNGSIQ